ncbi:hypothetical protein M406DRAFT_327958 [Cryphonectria parasitica EP155]|uniref:Uncharacterized protein n=1 Tax=Cryphonectria parasitica (strain ATCC 38755 / EP155) TaxID=660469 RepID=A0A9P4Y5Q2_CRYP1|nr:uncharacterized protein M406DRAFT_327958 [Cryphonectria parasitica EP155]KAF3766842.1 hypothetical protein M406DRAFT_327958 [Cryphonectria parasitica EP155]
MAMGKQQREHKWWEEEHVAVDEKKEKNKSSSSRSSSSGLKAALGNMFPCCRDKSYRVIIDTPAPKLDFNCYRPVYRKQEDENKSLIVKVPTEDDYPQKQADMVHHNVLETLRKLKLDSGWAKEEEEEEEDDEEHSSLGSVSDDDDDDDDDASETTSYGSVYTVLSTTTDVVPTSTTTKPYVWREPLNTAPRHAQPTPRQQQPHPDPAPCRRAFLYFTVERPHRGGFVRHMAHPMHLDLSTPTSQRRSENRLRAYLTRDPQRFFKHFGLSHRNGNRVVVNLPQFFSSRSSSSSSSSSRRRAVERIWGQELRWAWADAGEERFAGALVGLLRDVAEESARMMAAEREEEGGLVEKVTLDVVCVVRQVSGGGDGTEDYGMPMDVRRVIR